MITLATLPSATAQEVFDQVAKHLLTQMEKSSDPKNSSNCLYRSGSLSCAAGCLISDEEYKPEMEGDSWNLLRTIHLVPYEHNQLINQLQHIHDDFQVESWHYKLTKTAQDHQLDASVLEGFSSCEPLR